MKQFIVWCSKEKNSWVCCGTMHERLAKACALSLESEGYEVRVVPRQNLTWEDIIEG